MATSTGFRSCKHHNFSLSKSAIGGTYSHHLCFSLLCFCAYVVCCCCTIRENLTELLSKGCGNLKLFINFFSRNNGVLGVTHYLLVDHLVTDILLGQYPTKFGQCRNPTSSVLDIESTRWSYYLL